jgi:hypothetical protein
VVHGGLRRFQQLADQAVALAVRLGLAALLDLGEPVVQGLDQELAALRVVQQVVLQIGIALHDPDVAQHLVKHAGRAAGAALLAQAVQEVPGMRAEHPDHDLAVRERGVVVRDLAQARRVAIRRGHELFECRWRVHLVRAMSANGEAGAAEKGCYRSAASACAASWETRLLGREGRLSNPRHTKTVESRLFVIVNRSHR